MAKFRVLAFLMASSGNFAGTIISALLFLSLGNEDPDGIDTPFGVVIAISSAIAIWILIANWKTRLKLIHLFLFAGLLAPISYRFLVAGNTFFTILEIVHGQWMPYPENLFYNLVLSVLVNGTMIMALAVLNEPDNQIEKS
ncbi:MAG: hypothetical protein AB1483_13860 [Candidatus Zixiibacteriota bacterium]